MKTCTEHWQAPLLDHAAGAPAAMELARHLAQCAVCSAALLDGQRRMAEIDAGLHQRSAAEASPQAISRAIAAAREQERGARPMGWRWAAAAFAVAAMLIVSLGFVFRAHQQQRQALSAAVALNSWRSPTEGLLQSPSDRWLSASPKVAEYFYPLDNQFHKNRGTTP